MGGGGSSKGKGKGKGGPGKGAPSAPVQPGCTVFCFHVPNSWDEAELERHFRHCGRILTCAVQRKPDGESRGFGFISFETREAARKAILGLHGFTTGMGKFITVSIKKGEEAMAIPIEEFPPKGRLDAPVSTSAKDASVPPGATIFVFHLPNDWTEEVLHRHFIHFGTMATVTVMRKTSGESRGFGFVSFQFPQSANRAIEGFHGFCAGPGKFLKVTYKQEGQGADAGGFQQQMQMPQMGMSPPATAWQAPQADAGATLDEADFRVQIVRASLEQCFQDQLMTSPLDGSTSQEQLNALTAIASQAVQSAMQMLTAGGAPQMQHLKLPVDNTFGSKEAASQVPPGANLFVYRIPNHWSEDQLVATFSPYGNILSARVQRNPDQTSKGFGFVGFDTAESATLAIGSLHGTVVEGKELVVTVKSQDVAKGKGKGRPGPY